MLRVLKVLPNENIVKAMRTVYEFNVQKFKNGESGAVNGMLPNGDVDKSSVQSQEVWTGVTYAVASHLILQVSELKDYTFNIWIPLFTRCVFCRRVSEKKVFRRQKAFITPCTM